MVVSNHFATVGLAAVPTVASLTAGGGPHAVACSHVVDSQGACRAVSADSLQLALPTGGSKCPNSGYAAACSTTQVQAPSATAGVASTPDGQTPCTAPTDAALSSPASCSEAQPPGSSSDPAPGSIPTSSRHLVAPSVPISTLQPVASVQHVNLSAGSTSTGQGQRVVLTATAGASVTGTGQAIEIFDRTTGTIVGACELGSECVVAYAAGAGTRRFAAFVTAPTSTMPTDWTHLQLMSNEVSVTWVGVTLASKTSAVAPGKPVTVTATSTVPAGSGYALQLFDTSTNSRLTYCSQGNTCSVALSQASAGQRAIVGVLARPSSSLPAIDVRAQSDQLTATWLSVSIAVDSTYQIGSTVYLTATANADLTSTPWSLGIQDSQGHLVGQPCKTGSSCSVQATASSSGTAFSAVIGAVPPANSNGKLGELLQKVIGPAALVDLQAQSETVKPNRLLWGVDSCKSFTDDPTGGSGLYSQISGVLGAPDFWGRYLTDAVCPPLSSIEVAAAHTMHMGILPIYNERDCSNVSGYDTGIAYAAEAVASAKAIGLPQGRGIAIDIEPSGPACPGAANLDTGLIHGWYDGITAAHYAPIYYGNGTVGSEFATQWCYTVDALPYIGQNSYLWSFQPSLLGGYMKSNAPGFAPNRTGCTGYVHAWQYQIGSSSWAAPDVDGDEATSELPIWYP